MRLRRGGVDGLSVMGTHGGGVMGCDGMVRSINDLVMLLEVS